MRTLLLSVKVVPRSSRNEIVATLPDGSLRIKIAAPPEKGKANAELRSFLARHYGVPERDVTIVSGETSVRKRVKVNLPD